MTLIDQLEDVPPAPASASGPGPASPPLAAGLAAVVVGVLAGGLYVQGAFYPVDAFGVTVVALGLIAAGVAWNRDRQGIAVTVTVGGLAAWWFARAVAGHAPAAFFPFGAPALSFLAGFLVLRALGGRDRARTVWALVAVGSVLAGSGVVGVLGRWTALAQHTGGAWRASTTLTYPAAAAVVCAVAVLLALSCDLSSPFVRIAVATSVAGLLATQSHWELVAVVAGALVVPRSRWADALWPLACGAAAGVAVVASSSSPTAGFVAWVAALGLVGAAALPTPVPHHRAARRLALCAVALVAAGTAVAVLHLPATGGRTPTAFPGMSQTEAWSSSIDTWRSSAATGSGPPRVHTTGGAVSTYPGLAPDTYLASAADGGAVAAALLLASGAAVAAAIRRRDLLTSCAAAGLVAFAVAGCVDFAWQLPAIGLLGGCAAGLAATVVAPRRTETARAGEPDGHLVGADGGVGGSAESRFHLRAAAAWALVAITVVAVQGVAGTSKAAGSATRAVATEPPHLLDTSAPGRQILTGPDPTDPFMVVVGGRYYLYSSEGTTTRNVPLRTGTRPGRWAPPVDALPVLPGWAEGGLTWAPDVHRVTGGWALYFTALVKGINPPTHCVGAAYARSPSGPFVATPAPFICQLDHRGTIDARVIDTPGGLVMLSKSEDNANPSVPGPDQNGPTGIYAQHLSADGRSLLGQATRILGPTEPWEGTIVEAPDMVEAWGTWWLFFSGNWYSSPSYGIGVAACQSPFGPCTDPSPTPFLASNLQGPGPGEESLFTHGGAVWLLYNPFHANDPGPVIPRPVVMARLGFTAAGPYLAPA